MTESTRKIALVTGGSRGLGRSTALSLSQRGIDTVLTYRTERDKAQEVVDQAGQAGRKAVALQLDTGKISTFEDFAARLRQALSELGAERFDYLVNNAGISLHKPFAETTEADLDEIYNVQFKGVFFLTQTLLPLINDGGRIVNISSGLTRLTFAGSSAYASMKGAIEVLTRYLARELGERRIAVNTVAPGPIATDFSGGMVRDNPEVNQRIAAMTALGRAGVPDDLGPMIASLLADDNRWVNGQRIEVSGGLSL